MKEPDYICPNINKAQQWIAEYHERNEPGEDSELYDLHMGVLYMLDAIRAQVEGLRKWGRKNRKS